MNVVGHDDVSANSPSMPIMCRAPFISKNFGDIVGSKKLPAILYAGCHKINRRVDPNALQSSQVLVHLGVVARALTSAIWDVATRTPAAVSARGYSISAARRRRILDRSRKLCPPRSSQRG
jgi:hypothetical protein